MDDLESYIALGLVGIMGFTTALAFGPGVLKLLVGKDDLEEPEPEKSPKELVLDEVAKQQFPLIGKVPYHTQLRGLYNSGEISDNELFSSLEIAVNNQARTEYGQVMRRQYADHLCGNEALLVYAIDNGSITSEEAAVIPLDHGQTLTEYYNQFRQPHLLNNLKHKLLDPDAPELAGSVTEPLFLTTPYEA